MKEEALAIASVAEDPSRRLNLLREYLQAFILRSLHESEAALNLTFVGGTALRFLHNLPRFSEDLDFSLEQPAGYSPVAWLEKLKRDMALAGFNVTINWNDRKIVHTAWVRVGGLLKEVRLTNITGQNLSIKLEIDTRPPVGGIAVNTLTTRHFTFVIRHHDLPSLMAGKLHALITRSFPKGRDWFDLLWYRSLQPAVTPNLALLQNALDQTEGINTFEAVRWRDLVHERAMQLDISQLGLDIGPFLERHQDLTLVSLSNVKSALRL